QSSGHCGTDRTVSTLVGAGLGAAVGAIPATIVHNRNETASHRILAISIATGALTGFAAASRDRPCLPGSDSPRLRDAVLAKRSGHAWRGGLAGFVSGAVVGAAGSALYTVDADCIPGPCRTSPRTRITLLSAAEGAVAGGLLGSLIGWAWPVRR